MAFFLRTRVERTRQGTLSLSSGGDIIGKVASGLSAGASGVDVAILGGLEVGLVVWVGLRR